MIEQARPGETRITGDSPVTDSPRTVTALLRALAELERRGEPSERLRLTRAELFERLADERDERERRTLRAAAAQE